MCKFTQKTLFLVIFGVYLILPPAAFADRWQNERLHNGTGQDATDLEKWFEGDVRVSKWLSTRFTEFDYTYDGTCTKLRWSNPQPGPVKHCETVGACARTDKNKIKHCYLPRWSTSGEVAGPGLSDEFVRTGEQLADLIISNTAQDGGPITIETIQVGPVDTLYPIEDLFYDDVNDVSWTYTRTDVHLDLDSSEEFSDIDLPSLGGIVYRAKIHLDSDPCNVVEYVGQYTPTTIPTMSEWGLIVMALLLLGLGIVSIKRRLRPVPA